MQVLEEQQLQEGYQADNSDEKNLAEVELKKSDERVNDKRRRISAGGVSNCSRSFQAVSF